MTMIDPVLEQKMDAIAEQIFGTAQDPNQIPITKESRDKLNAITPNWTEFQVDDKGDPVAWVIVLPTTKELAHMFVEGKITEKQLLEITMPQDVYSAIYLCAVVTVPEYRRRGLGRKLFKAAVDKIEKTQDYILFAWPVGEGGLGLVRKVAKDLDREIIIRE